MTADIKAIRLRYRLTQSDLATILRIADSRTIRRWESGERPVSGPASIVLEMMDKNELPKRFYPNAASTP